MILTGENEVVSATLSTTNPMWTDVESTPDPHGETLVINRLSHCTYRFGLHYV